MKALRERVAFDAEVRVPDGAGGHDRTWEETHVCAADFRYLRGGEAVQAARLEGKQPVVVTIRDCVAARSIGGTFRMRDVRRGTVYNVRVAVPGDIGWIEVTAESGVAV